jgi:hypothetical protein
VLILCFDESGEHKEKRMVPSVTIYADARLAATAGDETWKRCDCGKHLRWTFEDQQLLALSQDPVMGTGRGKKGGVRKQIQGGGPEVIEESHKRLRTPSN